jgi:MarR family transcriptional regulator, organic hydroperoxide resistance regulator
MQQIKGYIGLLLIQIMKNHRRCAESGLGNHGLHAGQEFILLHLWDQDGMTQTQLAEALDVEPPTITKMISRMQSNDLVQRQPDPDDGRVMRVWLTEKGRSLREPVLAEWAKLEEQTLQRLTTREQAALRDLLSQILENVS